MDIQGIQEHLQLCAEEYLASEYDRPNWKIGGDEFELVTDERGNYTVPLRFERISDGALIEVDVCVTVWEPRPRRIVKTIKTNGLI